MTGSPIATEHGTQSKTLKLDARSKALRFGILKILESSRRGHLPSALSLIEILRVLYDDVMRYDSERPKWDQRDRFILSKGHGCLALYVLLIIIKIGRAHV